MFCRYSLRTTDLEAGRKFYSDALGLEVSQGTASGGAVEAWPLHERARAIGVPAHWLGHVQVPDAEAWAAQLEALGGTRLGPSVETPSGARYATLRDPFGTVISLREDAPESAAALSAASRVWHQLHTRDAEGALSSYCALFNWVPSGSIEAAQLEGGFRLFSFADGEPAVGMIANTGRWPGVHPHWLFHFPVRDLDGTVELVRALGGTAREPVALADRWLAACEDPQGAAFGLVSIV